VSARLWHAGAHTAPRPRRDTAQRADLAQLITWLIVALIVLVLLPAVALVWIAALITVGTLVVLLLGRVLQLGRPVPDQEGRHRG
jgi:fatty acid desaturase